MNSQATQRNSDSRFGAVFISSLAILSGLTLGFLSTKASVPLLAVALAVGAISGTLFLAFAWARFDAFLLSLLAIRPMLDALNLGGASSALSPSVAVGLAFVVAALAWLGVRYRRGELVRPSAATLGVCTLVIAAALSCLVSVSPVVSASSTVRLLAAALMFVVLEQTLATAVITRSALLKAVGVSAALVLAFAFLLVLVGIGAVDPFSGLVRMQGPFVHPNVLGKYLVVITLLLVGWALHLRGRSLVLALLALVPTIAALGMTYARSAWIAAFVGALYLVARRNWRLVPLIIGAVVVAAVSIPSIYGRISDLWTAQAPAVGVPQNSMQWRVEYWQHLIPLTRMSPFNGMGMDMIPYIGGQGLAAHNVWVQTYVEMGYVGIAALLAAIAGFVITIWRTVRPLSHSAGRPADHVAAQISIAIGIVLFVLMQTENLLSETTTLWYAAAAFTCGYAPALRGSTRDGA